MYFCDVAVGCLHACLSSRQAAEATWTPPSTSSYAYQTSSPRSPDLPVATPKQDPAPAEQELSAEFLAGLSDGDAKVDGHANGIAADGNNGGGADDDGDDGLDGTSVKDDSELADEVEAVDANRRVRHRGPTLDFSVS